jgi:hypothetical protein
LGIVVISYLIEAPIIQTPDQIFPRPTFLPSLFHAFAIEQNARKTMMERTSLRRELAF